MHMNKLGVSTVVRRDEIVLTVTADWRLLY